MSGASGRLMYALRWAPRSFLHGEPTFFVKKVFAMCSINHHNDGHIAVGTCPAIGIRRSDGLRKTIPATLRWSERLGGH